MGLSRGIAQAHIAEWSPRLSDTNRPYRGNWPSRLFRHEPVENAAAILKSGHLLSRNASVGLRPRDIAPEDIVNNRVAAHDFVRLYLRPKNPTQYRVEGIAKPAEYYRGDPHSHAPVLVIFNFDALEMLTRVGVHFSDGNMQSPHTVYGDSDEFFSSIPFEAVYHEGAFERSVGEKIIRCRCAEVLVPSPLQLDGVLQAVLCRSTAERATLLHYLGNAAAYWAPRIRVYSEPGIFESRYTYIDTFDATSGGVSFALHPRRDGAHVEVKVEIFSLPRERVVLRTGPVVLDPAKRWIMRGDLADGHYLAKVDLEGSRAFEAQFLIDELPF